MPDPAPIEIYKALADDTRYRLYRYLRLSGRPVSIRELSTRLSLHPNTLRPHLRRLEEAGLAASEVHRGATVGRPQVLYTAVAREEREGRDYRLLGEILAGLIVRQATARTRGGRRSRVGRVPGRAERSASGRPRTLRPQPRGPPGGARRGRVRPPVPTAQLEDGRDLAPRLPLPRPARRAPGAGLRRAQGAPGGHARRVATIAPPDGVRAARRAIRGLSPGRSRRLNRSDPIPRRPHG